MAECSPSDRQAAGRVQLIGMTEDELKAFFTDLGEPGFRASQVMNWIYKRRAASFDGMTNLPKALRDRLSESADIGYLETWTKQESKLDGVVKYLFRLRDGHGIETVLMRYSYGSSVCVSTQVGCRMGCAFCASTLGGRVRDLAAGEILAEVVTVQKEIDPLGERVGWVVLMGSGEPLDNYDEVVKFLYMVNSESTLGISHRHVTLSTSGIVPRIYDLAGLKLQITLAVSLHAPYDELRDRLVPINREYPIAELMKACRHYFEVTGRRITYEYSLMKGINDSPEHAEALARLLAGQNCHVNLIPVNPVRDRGIRRSSEEDVEVFRRNLEARRIAVTVRRELGTDIDAACGQLRRRILGVLDDARQEDFE